MNTKKHWNLVTNHGAVMLLIATRPDYTMRQLASDLLITERQVARIVKDLTEADLLRVTRNGRRNVYAINPEGAFRRPILQHIKLTEFASLMGVEIGGGSLAVDDGSSASRELASIS